MTDGRGSDAALALASLREKPKIGTSAAKAARSWLIYVLAEATTYKDFRPLTRTSELPLFPLINPGALQLPSTENYSLYGREPAL
jgi:hypothetical protein